MRYLALFFSLLFLGCAAGLATTPGFNEQGCPAVSACPDGDYIIVFDQLDTYTTKDGAVKYVGIVKAGTFNADVKKMTVEQYREVLLKAKEGRDATKEKED
jgi:hypothetical protein